MPSPLHYPRLLIDSLLRKCQNFHAYCYCHYPAVQIISFMTDSENKVLQCDLVTIIAEMFAIWQRKLQASISLAFNQISLAKGEANFISAFLPHLPFILPNLLIYFIYLTYILLVLINNFLLKDPWKKLWLLSSSS